MSSDSEARALAAQFLGDDADEVLGPTTESSQEAPQEAASEPVEAAPAESDAPAPEVAAEPAESNVEASEGEAVDDSAHQAWERREASRLRRQLQDDRQRYEAMILQLYNQRPAGEEAPQQQAPEEEAPWNIDEELQQFYAHHDEKLLGAIQQMVSPLLQKQQEEAFRAQQQAQIQSQQQQMQGWLSEVNAAEAEYADSPQGKGYFDRVENLRGQLESQALGLVKIGAMQPGQEKQYAAANIMGLIRMATDLSQQSGHSVAELIDTLVRDSTLSQPAAVAPVSAAVPSKAPAKRTASANVQAAQAASRDGAAGRIPAAASVPEEGISAQYVAEVGVDRALTPELLDKWHREGKYFDHIQKLIEQDAQMRRSA